MYNIPRSNNGLFGPVMLPLKTQKRDFASFSLSNVAVMPGKSFKNPNFVNNHHPNVHCHYSSTPASMPNHNFCQKTDTSGTVTEKLCTESYINSSQNSIENYSKEIPCESPVKKISVETSPMCYSRKRCKKVRRNRKKKIPNKNSKQNNSRRQINDMMEIDLEPDISINGCDSISNMTTLSPKSLHLTDFLGENISETSTKPCKNDELFTFISISPPNCSNCPRERELSVCESEDSFIVFDSGTDEELKFSDSDDNTELDSDTEEDASDSDIDDDFDSSYSVVPSKKVRFAEKEDLCEVHPMVQWSFAYRKARKGPWEEYARDRERFNKRINQTEAVLGPVFDRQHRQNVYRERFNENVR